MSLLGRRSRVRLLASFAVASSVAVTGAVFAGSDGAALVADAVRAVAGDRVVADLEDLVYGARDRLDRVRHDGERPSAHWEVPQPSPVPEVAPERAPQIAAWSPVNVGPMHDDFAAEGDGVWVPVSTSGSGDVLMKKTLLHPDRTRSMAELFVVAIDLSRITLHYVAGTEEPENVTPNADDYARHGDIDARDRDTLLAAFNGGFKTRHGHHGVAVDGVTLVPFKPDLCTLVGKTDGSLALASFKNLPPPEDATFVRQTARCLVEDGVRHPALAQELAPSWGAAVGGDTVIRRSAVGLSGDGRTLFVGVSNRTTATAIADGMRHAGASTAAQLDVNEAFPRFLTYKKNDKGSYVADSIAPGFHHRAGHYVDAPSSRDFFYITRKTTTLASRTDGAAGAG